MFAFSIRHEISGRKLCKHVQKQVQLKVGLNYCTFNLLTG